MGGETAIFICIVIAMFFISLTGAGVVGLWYLKNLVMDLIDFMTEDEEESELEVQD